MFTVKSKTELKFLLQLASKLYLHFAVNHVVETEYSHQAKLFTHTRASDIKGTGKKGNGKKGNGKKGNGKNGNGKNKPNLSRKKGKRKKGKLRLPRTN